MGDGTASNLLPSYKKRTFLMSYFLIAMVAVVFLNKYTEENLFQHLTIAFIIFSLDNFVNDVLMFGGLIILYFQKDTYKLFNYKQLCDFIQIIIESNFSKIFYQVSNALGFTYIIVTPAVNEIEFLKNSELVLVITTITSLFFVVLNLATRELNSYFEVFDENFEATLEEKLQTQEALSSNKTTKNNSGGEINDI